MDGDSAGALSMRFDQVKNKIGYVCIFIRSSEEAIRHLLDLITGERCGFDEGAAAWQSALEEWLQGQHDVLELNACGAAFTADEWGAILRGVSDGLAAFLENGPKGEQGAGPA